MCDHKWENPVISEADCVNASTRTVTCACGAIGVTEVTPCTENHAVTNATCTIPSYCTVPGCGYIAAEALGHDWTKGDGICGNCGVACGHRFVDGAGNSTNGVCFTCGVACAHEYDDNCDVDCNVCEAFRAAPHTLGEAIPAKVPANCLEEGYNEHWICEDCGAYLMSDGMGGYYETNPAWMNYTGEHVRPEGTPGCAVVACTLCGEDSYGTDACVRDNTPVCQDGTCVNCGGIVYGEGHSYGYDEETWEPLQPFCQPGDCIHCGEHLDYIYECENGSYAPCSVDGECVHGCGKLFPATGIHELDDPCAGGTCWMCWEEIEGAHNYVDGACSNCGEADPSVPTGPEQVDALNFEKIAFNLGAKIGVQFALNNNNITAGGYEKAYVKVTMTVYDSKGVPSVQEIILTEGQVAGKYLVYIYGAAPKLMGREMIVQAFAEKDGKEYCGAAQTYSLKQGIMDLLASNYATSINTSKKEADRVKAHNRCILLVDMLYYGAEAQTRFAQADYDGLVTEGLEDKYVAFKTTAEPTFTAINTPMPKTENELFGLSLGVADAVELQFTFTLEEGEHDKYTVKVTCAGVDYLYTSESFQYAYKNYPNRATIVCGELAAKQMRDEVTVVLLKDGKEVSQTYTTSIESVATAMGTTATNKNYALARAMMTYGDSAKVCFG